MRQGWTGCSSGRLGVEEILAADARCSQAGVPGCYATQTRSVGLPRVLAGAGRWPRCEWGASRATRATGMCCHAGRRSDGLAPGCCAVLKDHAARTAPSAASHQLLRAGDHTALAAAFFTAHSSLVAQLTADQVDRKPKRVSRANPIQRGPSGGLLPHVPSTRRCEVEAHRVLTVGGGGGITLGGGGAGRARRSATPSWVDSPDRLGRPLFQRRLSSFPKALGR